VKVLLRFDKQIFVMAEVEAFACAEFLFLMP
jgi:hypothetical protein